MNILFITLIDIRTIRGHDIYSDLMREFVKNGHSVFIISPVERRYCFSTQIIEDEENVHILKLKTGNIQKTKLIEKGISTVMLEFQLLRGIKKYFSNVHFDLILYSTPPITVFKPVKYVKKRDNAKTYLMLKDIFPQNAVDIGMMSTTGLIGVLYKYFRNKEKKLYSISDRIGCTSQANVDYILRHNPAVTAEKVEICPNCIEVQDMRLTPEECFLMRKRYGIPTDKTVFVYGGNLGKPQGIPFIVECLRAEKDNKDAFFLIVGDGTEYQRLEAFIDEEGPTNVKLMKRLPKNDYDRMIAACDVGLLFLDHRFTIPNFPGRLLSYMQASLPVLACTDPNTDVGKVIVEGGFGWWCESNDVAEFYSVVSDVLKAVESSEKLKNMIENESNYLIEHYSVEKLFSKIEIAL